MNKQYVAICEKVALTIEEAAEYSNIGQNRISSLLKEPRCPFVLYVGTKKLGKRKHKRFKKLQECRVWIADALMWMNIVIVQCHQICWSINVLIIGLG